MRYLLLFLLSIAFAVKPIANAAGITFSALLGGRGSNYSEDNSTDAAVDKDGNIYIVGNTQSSDFPATSLGDPAIDGGCFVTKLSPAGAVLYSVILPGASGRAIAVNKSGEAVIAGETSWSGLATKNAAQSVLGGMTDAFVAKLTANGGLAFATFYGGSDIDVAFGVDVDLTGNIYITGFTESNDLPVTTGAGSGTLGGNHDAFLLKLSADGAQKLLSTHVGGEGYDIGSRVLAAGDGRSVYIAGKTTSTRFVGSQVTNADENRVDAFVARFTVDTGALTQMAFWGGTGTDAASGLATDAKGEVYMCGETTSSDFPTTPDSAQPMAGGGTDLFVVKLGADLQARSYATYLGGDGDEMSTDRTQWLSNTEGSFPFPTTRIAVDDLGWAYVASSGQGISFPARSAPGAPVFKIGTGQQPFVARLNPSGAEVDGILSVNGYEPRGLVITGNTVVMTGATGFAVYPPFFPTTPGAFNGEYKGNVSDAFITQLSFASSDPIHATPPNDDRANATRIDGIARTFAGSNVGATPETDGSETPHAGSPPSHSVWWTYKAELYGFLFVTTLGSHFDTVLTIYASNLDNRTGILAENDDLQTVNPTRASGIKIPVQKDVVYDFAVDGKNGETGDIALSIVFSNAINDDLESRKLINTFPIAISSSNRGSSRQIDEPYHAAAGRNSVWWEWTAPVTASVRLSTKGSSFPALLAIYTGSVLADLTQLASIAGGNDLSLAVEAGHKYQIAVDGAYGDTGDIELRIDLGDPPGNDDFIHATPIPGIKAEIATSNLYASVEPGEEAVRTIGGGRTVWWSWTAPTNGWVTVTALNKSVDSEMDTDLMMFTGTALTNLHVVASNEDLSLTPRILDSRVSIEVETGVAYFIRVDNSRYARQGGPFTLKLDFARPPKILPGVSILNGMFRLQAKGLAGAAYQVQTSVNFLDWTDLAGEYQGEDLTVMIPTSTREAAFFRLVDKSE